MTNTRTELEPNPLAKLLSGADRIDAELRPWLTLVGASVMLLIFAGSFVFGGPSHGYATPCLLGGFLAVTASSFRARRHLRAVRNPARTSVQSTLEPSPVATALHHLDRIAEGLAPRMNAVLGVLMLGAYVGVALAGYPKPFTVAGILGGACLARAGFDHRMQGKLHAMRSEVRETDSVARSEATA